MSSKPTTGYTYSTSGYRSAYAKRLASTKPQSNQSTFERLTSKPKVNPKTTTAQQSSIFVTN
ncbi:hypothetical protein BLNAU_4115 [Blattamonas nauphoetae]|uniref:Uncharacterized protein n=1 Tax=Blattamonas nauphoetae TaxID=2049346 RepID=A0ABQ9YBH1_9EUKA|nr:hypothetical protein BLNAU_4115 [Blattamonas nauphoetae]